MSSEDPSHNRQQLVVPFHDAESVRRPRQSLQSGHEFFDVLSSPLSEDTARSDDEWRQRNVDNILALLKANAQLRALAVKLSDILAARGGWNEDSIAKAVGDSASKAGNPRRRRGTAASPLRLPRNTPTSS